MKSTPTVRWSLFILCFSFAACTHTIAVTDYSRYYDQSIMITTKDSTSYHFTSGWTSDSLHNITGRGLKSTETAREAYHGIVPGTAVDHITIKDESGPANLIILAAVVGGLSAVIFGMRTH